MNKTNLIIIDIFATLILTNFTECRNQVERVIFCDETFTQEINRKYTIYSGCLISKMYKEPLSFE